MTPINPNSEAGNSNPRTSLEEQEKKIKTLRKDQKRYGFAFVSSLIPIGILAWGIHSWAQSGILFGVEIGGLGFLAFIAFFLFATFVNAIASEREEKFLLERLQNEAATKDLSPEERLFKDSEIQIRQYYALTLQNNKLIFLVGILCLLAGFIVLGFTMHFLFTSNGDVMEKLVAGTIGSISGFLTNYIGGIYLKMHAKVSEALTEFHGRLVSTHHRHFGNYLASTIHDPVMRNEVIRQMALKLYDVAPVAPARPASEES